MEKEENGDMRSKKKLSPPKLEELSSSISDMPLNATCDTSADCDGNGVTMCCVNIITTSKNGAMDQMFRCMNRGFAEMSFEQTYTSDSGDDMYVNMKSLADSANFVKAGIATALVLIASLY